MHFSLLPFVIAVTATGWKTGFYSWQEQGFSLLHPLQAESGSYPASYPMGMGALSSVVNWWERESD